MKFVLEVDLNIPHVAYAVNLRALLKTLADQCLMHVPDYVDVREVFDALPGDRDYAILLEMKAADNPENSEGRAVIMRETYDSRLLAEAQLGKNGEAIPSKREDVTVAMQIKR